MKVEVELSEIEYLRSRLSQEEEKAKRLEKGLNELSEAELKRRAITLSYRLFEKYISAVFTKLGFKDNSWEGEVKFSGDLEPQLGKDWWNKKDDITVTIGATITEQFRSAFLRIGVVPKEQIQEPEELKL